MYFVAMASTYDMFVASTTHAGSMHNPSNADQEQGVHVVQEQSKDRTSHAESELEEHF